MKKNELVPVGNGESFTRCGWIRLALKTLFEDPHASFFVETIPLCVQLNLIVLLRLVFPAPIEWILCLAATGRAFV